MSDLNVKLMLTNGSVWKIGTLSIEKRLWYILETSKYPIQMWRKRCIKAKLIHFRVSFIYFQSIVSGKSKAEDI